MNGDYTGVVPPVPIPNTEVKCAEADDTPMGESRKSPFTALDFFCFHCKRTVDLCTLTIRCDFVFYDIM